MIAQNASGLKSVGRRSVNCVCVQPPHQNNTFRFFSFSPVCWEPNEIGLFSEQSPRYYFETDILNCQMSTKEDMVVITIVFWPERHIRAAVHSQSRNLTTYKHSEAEKYPWMKKPKGKNLLWGGTYMNHGSEMRIFFAFQMNGASSASCLQNLERIMIKIPSFSSYRFLLRLLELLCCCPWHFRDFQTLGAHPHILNLLFTLPPPHPLCTSYEYYMPVVNEGIPSRCSWPMEFLTFEFQKKLLDLLWINPPLRNILRYVPRLLLYLAPHAYCTHPKYSSLRTVSLAFWSFPHHISYGNCPCWVIKSRAHKANWE